MILAWQCSLLKLSQATCGQNGSPTACQRDHTAHAQAASMLQAYAVPAVHAQDAGLGAG